MVVLEGTGTIITEGKLVDEKRVNAYNLSGPSISGGNSHAVVAATRSSFHRTHRTR